MCGYFCIGIGLLDYTNLFSPNDYETNDKTKRIKKLYCIICSKYRKLEKPKISYILEKTLVLSLICSKCKNEDEKICKEEESTEILEVLALTENIYIILTANFSLAKWGIKPLRLQYNK